MSHNFPMSPSNSERWINCLGYYDAVKDLPPVKENLDMAAGTRAHSLFEASLRLEVPPLDLDGDDEEREAVQQAYDYVQELRGSRFKPVQYWAEQWLPMPFLPLPKRLQRADIRVGGTCDAGVADTVTLEAIDYKHGAGVLVDAEGNPQVMLYIAGLRELVGKRPWYRGTIIQPRARHVRGPKRTVTLQDDELDDFLEIAVNAWKANLDGGKRSAGDHCRWCPAAGTCATQAQYMLDVVQEDW